MIEIGKYRNPKSTGFIGWICTRTWIAFEKTTGETLIYRRAESGAVVGDPLVA